MLKRPIFGCRDVLFRTPNIQFSNGIDGTDAGVVVHRCVLVFLFEDCHRSARDQVFFGQVTLTSFLSVVAGFVLAVRPSIGSGICVRCDLDFHFCFFRFARSLLF